MGIYRDNRTGTYFVRRKVPKGLEAAVARITGSKKVSQSYLKKSLGTKDAKQANVLAKPALIAFDRVLAKAAAETKHRPMKSMLSDQEIERIAAYHYAILLEEDEEVRREGTGSEQVRRAVAEQVVSTRSREELSRFEAYFPPEPATGGLTDREMQKIEETHNWVLPEAQKALARGNISFIAEEVDELLEIFAVHLDRNTESYRKLCMAVLRQSVAAHKATKLRHEGEVIATPAIVEPQIDLPEGGQTLRAALEGWKKAKSPTKSTVDEWTNAVGRFEELHGNMPIAAIKRSHVTQFREALQLMPVRRTSAQRTATLPELVAWSKEHPEVRTASNATVNKLLGGVQAVALWGRDNGLVPDDVHWADPFTKMRLRKVRPSREPWRIDELQRLFNSAIFVEGERPKAGGGDASFWLPLLGIFTGTRLGELAALTVDDVVFWSTVPAIVIKEDEGIGARVKTASSRRTVPVHPELVRLGLLTFVEARRNEGGAKAQLFSGLVRGARGGFGEQWSKWFGRYIRRIGITNPNSVFHSFRHGFKDALRRAGVSDELSDALMGHAGRGSEGRSYGARDTVARYGIDRLVKAVASVHYDGLDLSRLRAMHDIAIVKS